MRLYAADRVTRAGADVAAVAAVAAGTLAPNSPPAQHRSLPTGHRPLFGPILHLMAFQVSGAMVPMTSLLKDG